jgi:uncharacterized membrane protein required for colicin V production
MITDIIIIGFAIIIVFNGWRHGLLLTLLNLAVAMFSFLAAWLLMVPAAGLIEKAPFLSPLAVQIENRLLEPVQKSGSSLMESIAGLNLPEPLETLLIRRFPDSNGSFSDMWQEISASVFKTAVTAGIFILIFTILLIILYAIARKLSGLVNYIPLLGTANRMAGAIASLIILAAVLHIVLLALALVIPVFPSLEKLTEQSFIVNWFYDSESWHVLLDIIFS